MFRLIFAVIFFTGLLIGAIHRGRARIQGGAVSEAHENRLVYLILRGGGLVLWLSCFAVIFFPQALAWSILPLPTWARWFGVALSAAALPLIVWAAVSIGDNVTRTVATRAHHELVTWGPYRLVRHPLYTFGCLFFLGLGLVSSSGWLLGLLLIAFIALMIRLPQEEAMLAERFGDAYHNYRSRTGALLPRWR